MKDDLKKYVDQHRSEFEAFRPESDEIWQGVLSNLDREDSKGGLLKILAPYYKVAAILIVGMGILFYWYQTQTQALPSSQALQFQSISPELGETADYYQGMINEKMEFIQANSNLIDPIIIEDLDVLDQAFGELKNDLAENVDNEEVVNAMIKNYRIKLKILEHILEEIQAKQNSDESEINS